MVFRFTMIAAVLLALLGGCTKSGGDDMKAEAGDIQDKVKVSADHVWSGQVKALDKAKSVGQTLMDAAEKQRRAIDEDGR